MSYLADGAVVPEFAELLVWLAEATGARLTEGRIRSYAQDLGDVPFAPLKEACARARRECRFFPTLPEIRQHLAPPPEDAPLIAWTALNQAVTVAGAYGSVEIEDGAAARALEVVFGSWPEFCAYADGPGLAIKRQEFLACYRAARRESRGLRRLAGLCEASGAYPDGFEATRVWTARISASGQVTARRDAPQLGEAPERPALGEGR